MYCAYCEDPIENNRAIYNKQLSDFICEACSNELRQQENKR